MDFDTRYRKVLDLRESLRQHREQLIELAVRNLQFTVRDTEKEVDITLERLQMLEQVRDELARRAPLWGSDSQVALMLSYNSSAWLNTAIASIFVAGNRVEVKFSSKGRDLMELTAAIYAPIFGREINFVRVPGRASWRWR
ncbi:MAG: hypothetical protein WHS46_12500 [Desulfosoma sp.]